MNPSTIHADAARRNGVLSQGPVTAEGKQRSSQNARKHNFFTNLAVLPGEDQAEFDALLADFTEEHQPATPTERRYVREMADAELRLRRVRYYAGQTQINAIDATKPSDTPMVDAFQKLAETGQTLQLLLRYERHFQRQFDSALKVLLDLKKRGITDKREEAKRASDAHLKALEQLILAPTPGELYGYNDGGDDDEDDDLEDSEPTLQNEPNLSPQHPPIRR